MAEALALQIHLNIDAETKALEAVRDDLSRRSQALSEEFPELTHLEITLHPDGDDIQATAHATGKSTEVAAHAQASEAAPAAEKLLHTLRQQLRRTHDKKIFAHRREARKANPRRG